MLATHDTPVIRAMLAASLLFAIATLAIAINTAHAAGALAIGSCGAYGEAFDYRTIAEASAGALAKCHGEGCKVIAVTKKGCAAFAVDLVNACGGYGWGRGSHLGVTQNAALQACYKAGGKECVIRTFFCDAKG